MAAPATQVLHDCDGPWLEIGPQHAPGPWRLIQRADRSAAKSDGGVNRFPASWA
jgi:hypothetical protein